MDLDIKNLLIYACMKEIMLMESLKELENTVGKMESSMKVNGLME
jgi:hypothetical protein